MRNVGSGFMMLVAVLVIFCTLDSEIQGETERFHRTVIEIQCEQAEILLEPGKKIEIDQELPNFGRDLKNFDHIRIFYEDVNLSGECVASSDQKGYFLIIRKYKQTGNTISFEQDLDIEEFHVRTSFTISPSVDPNKLHLETNHMDLLTTEFEQLRIYNLEGYRISRKKRSPEDDLLSVDTEDSRTISDKGDSVCFFSAKMYIENMSFDEKYGVDIKPIASFSLKNTNMILTDSDNILITLLDIDGNRILGSISDKVEWGDEGHRQFKLLMPDAKVDIGRFKTSDNKEKLRIRIDGQMTEELVPIISIEKKFRKQNEAEEFTKMTDCLKVHDFYEYDTVQIRVQVTNNIDKSLDIHVIDEQEDRGDIISNTNGEYFDNVGPDKTRELFYAYTVKPLENIFSKGKVFTNNKIVVYYRFSGNEDDPFKRIDMDTDNTTIKPNLRKAEFERRGYTSGQLRLHYLEGFYIIYSAFLVSFIVYMIREEFKYLFLWVYLSLVPICMALAYTEIPFDPYYNQIFYFVVISGLTVLGILAFLYKDRIRAIGSAAMDILRSRESSEED
jgi:hypothetical protein